MIADPISDFIIRLQNAAMVGKSSVSLPTSKLKVAVANVLAREGYLTNVDAPKAPSQPLVVTLAYRGAAPVINGVKRISKPSRRLYAGVHDIHPVKRGRGLLVLSTPAGILTGKEAREKKMGGELLFEIW